MTLTCSFQVGFFFYKEGVFLTKNDKVGTTDVPSTPMHACTCIYVTDLAEIILRRSKVQ